MNNPTLDEARDLNDPELLRRNDYHLPHHLFPMVPYYNLRKLHALFMKKAVY